MTVKIKQLQGDRKGYLLTTELLVAEPRARVFEFFADAFQLETITPPWLHFSVQTPGPIEMRAGAFIDYRLRLRGFPIRWRSKISSWEPPYQFVDEQVRGPYLRWHHLHTFERAGGGTLVRDLVHYDLPLGRILHSLVVRRDLTKIFEYRHRMLSRLFTPMTRGAHQTARVS